MKPTITFGSDQQTKETPKAIKNIYKTLMFLSGFYLLVIQPRFPNIPEHVNFEIATWTTVATYGIYYVCQFFGYKCPDKQDVQDVQEEPVKLTRQQLGEQLMKDNNA